MNSDYNSRKVNNRNMSQEFLHYKAMFEIMKQKIEVYEQQMAVQRQAALDYDDY